MTEMFFVSLALLAFIALVEGRVLEWAVQKANTFGWRDGR